MLIMIQDIKPMIFKIQISPEDDHHNTLEDQVDHEQKLEEVSIDLNHTIVTKKNYIVIVTLVNLNNIQSHMTFSTNMTDIHPILDVAQMVDVTLKIDLDHLDHQNTQGGKEFQEIIENMAILREERRNLDIKMKLIGIDILVA